MDRARFKRSLRSLVTILENYVDQNLNAGPKNSARPAGFEALESRAMLSTYTVLNNGDSGAGSLRQAIISANSATCSRRSR